MLNEVRLIGRLMGIPKLLVTEVGPIWAVGLETTEERTGEDATLQPFTDWNELRLTDADALALIQAATGGDLLYVEGKLRSCPKEQAGVSFLANVVEVSSWALPLASHGVPSSSKQVRSRWSRVSRGARRLLASLVPRGFRASRGSRSVRET